MPDLSDEDKRSLIVMAWMAILCVVVVLHLDAARGESIKKRHEIDRLTFQNERAISEKLGTKFVGPPDTNVEN